MVETSDELWLADWRRRVAELYARWRAGSESDPEQATHEFRAGRDELFRAHPQSPLPPAERLAYRGVPYWPYDPAYRVSAEFEVSADFEPLADEAPDAANDAAIALPSSGAQPFRLRRIGRAVLGGALARASLTVFWLDDYAGGLFLPFRDATSGTQTYGAGRYLLDTAKGADLGGDPAAGRLTLDFNMAYHPSCVYDARWNCPLAPPENRLAVPVPAGERLAEGR